ncbi:BNR-4 repeat-containing protein [Pseudoalteromonas sp. ZZD1]|uniref:BNR-4 repeat-containing protein n=1 Tax=Pseudoalteromonas sp. ZZD1 TaxID=3139395 RepID=UPI003BAB953C
MKKIIKPLSVISTCLALLLAGCSDKKSSNAEYVDYFANDAIGNPLAIVQHPAGIYHDGVTYVSYQGPLEDPYVASYNHETKEWEGPYKAGISDMGKDPSRSKIDNHGKPTILMDDLGYIHVFFGGHGGMPKHGKNPLGNTHYGRNIHAVTKKPYDISSWEELDTIPVFGTYNQAVKMDNGDIYLFYRHGAHRSDWVYQKSTDHGRTFEAPVSFLKHKRRDDIEAVDSWYAWVDKGDDGEIIIGYDYHVCWDGKAGINGRGHTTERHNAYYMTFDTKNDVWKNVKGEQLPLPITREIADQKTLALDTGDKWTFNGTVHLDSNGYPHLATNIGKDIGMKTGGPKQTTHIRWNGSKWLSHSAVDSNAVIKNQDTRGDLIVKSPDEVSFILEFKDGDDGVISYWNSNDAGKTFEQGDELIRRKGANWALTSIIQNGHPDARMVVAEKQKGEANRKVYLLGDEGPIQRLKSEIGN